MAYDLILKNARIPQGERLVDVNILVNNSKIVGFSTQDDLDAAEIIDGEGCMVLPGCIDSHTHINDPGFTHREDFFTGTSAAAAGGITTVIDMPCCSIPSVRGVSELENKISQIKDKAVIDYAMWGGVTGEDVRNGNLKIVQEQAEQGVVAFKVYMTPSIPTYPGVSDAEMLECFYEVAKTGLPIGIHAENYSICDYYIQKLKNEGRKDALAWTESRRILAEKVAIELGISFSEETGARLHIVHMSSGAGTFLVAEAKKRGLDVTSETCPHYLTITAEDTMPEFKQLAKMCPPLRTKNDNDLLWKALANGTIDFVTTDHAPYDASMEKEAEGMDIWTALPGIPGLETMVPVIISEGYNKGKLTLSRLVEVLCKNPAVHYGLYPKKGTLEIGADADFTIIDLNKEWTIDKDKTFSKAKFTPLHGMKIKGKVVKTVVRGKLVFDENKGIVANKGYGEFIKRQTISKLPRLLSY